MKNLNKNIFMKKKEKIKINCPECNKFLTKKYISKHIKNAHKDIQYSKVVKRGMKFKFQNKNNIFIRNTEFYCTICKVVMNDRCKYAHWKSNLHKKLFNLYNKSQTKKELYYERYKNANAHFSSKVNENHKKIVFNKNDSVQTISNEKKSNTYDNLFSEEINNNAENTINNIISKFNSLNSNSSKFDGNSDGLISVKQKDELSIKSSRSKISYSKISNGLIPKNFLIHRITNSICKDNFSNDKSDVYSKTYDNKSNFSDVSESSSNNGEESLKLQTISLISADEAAIRKRIDEIFQKIENKKYK